MTRYAAVILDADSTLTGVEGIDWLAARRGGSVAREVAELTARAMTGDVPLESVYEARLLSVAPTQAELADLAGAYLAAAAPDAARALRTLRRAGVALRVVSGGLRPALLPLTRALGFADPEVRAVEPRFDARGAFAGVAPSPLTTGAGKSAVARELALPAPVLAVGDGVTDLAMRPAVDAFAAYTGFVRRAPVVAAADFVLSSFAELAVVVGG